MITINDGVSPAFIRDQIFRMAVSETMLALATFAMAPGGRSIPLAIQAKVTTASMRASRKSCLPPSGQLLLAAQFLSWLVCWEKVSFCTDAAFLWCHVSPHISINIQPTDTVTLTTHIHFLVESNAIAVLVGIISDYKNVSIHAKPKPSFWTE